MFNLFGKRKVGENRHPGTVYATQDGVAVPLAQVPDDVIGGGILGSGVAIIPNSGRVVAPVDGTVTAIADSRHAFCFETSDGLEVMVHIGVDTVALKGKGFEVLVTKGDYVLAGTAICQVDLALLAENKLPCHTAVLIPNHQELGGITPAWGAVKAGASTVIRYRGQAT